MSGTSKDLSPVYGNSRKLAIQKPNAILTKNRSAFDKINKSKNQIIESKDFDTPMIRVNHVEEYEEDILGTPANIIKQINNPVQTLEESVIDNEAKEATESTESTESTETKTPYEISIEQKTTEITNKVLDKFTVKNIVIAIAVCVGIYYTYKLWK